MEKRTRRPHGIRSRKVSISMSAADLRVLSARAKALHGGNLSAAVHELVDTLRREAAADEVLAMLGADRITNDELDELRTELAPKRRRKRRTAA